jgi:geranylgeranyl pyrophosphate synthase
MSTLQSHTNAATDVEAIGEILRRGGPGLRERMRRIEGHLEQVASEAGAPLATHASATVLAGGKRLRPLPVVLAAETGGGAADHAEREVCLVRAAVAVELVHSATLVHDDVIDCAPLRRGKPTIAASAGPTAAVATGDLLFSRAFAELARNNDPEQLRALSDASCALVAGELLQHEDAYVVDITVQRYLERCRLKTAALFEAACRLGALVAVEGSSALAACVGEFAGQIGLAFQLLDDVLDVSGPEERTGKSRGTDLLDGTVTLPLILARERDPQVAAFDLAGLRDPAEAQVLCDRIATTEALTEARARALTIVAEAKSALLRALGGRSVLLELVADAVVDRYC